MRQIDLASDIALILKHSRVSGNSRINDLFIQARIDDYRATAIRNSYSRNLQLDPSVFSDMGVETADNVTDVDDPALPAGCTNVGRYVMPNIVSLPNDRGLVEVTEPSLLTRSNGSRYALTSITDFRDKITHRFYKQFNWMARVNRVLYMYPYRRYIHPILILARPTDGYVINTGTVKSGELIYQTDWRQGEVYLVKTGGVTHNGTQYNQGQTFTAVNADFTGNGTVVYANTKRHLTIEDDFYPMPNTMAEEVAMKILQQDFQLEKREVADIRNDANDQLLLLKQQAG